MVGWISPPGMNRINPLEICADNEGTVITGFASSSHGELTNPLPTTREDSDDGSSGALDESSDNGDDSNDEGVPSEKGSARKIN